jgi:hypothetical protein
MRRVVICLVLFLVSISAATGVHAATDCERWITEYKNSLSKSPVAHKVQAAHRRLHHYVHKQIAAAKPKPKVVKPRVLPARMVKPRMTRTELLKKMADLCGDLPNEIPLADGPKTPVAELVPPRESDGTPMELASGDTGSFLQSTPPPQYTPPTSGYPGSPRYPSIPPIGGGPPTVYTPPTVPTPEPGSFVLLFTGLSGIAEVVRRRRKSS